MSDLQRDMQEYRKQMAAGVIPRAYRGLIDFMLALRIYLEKGHPDHQVSASLYVGYMDMTYLAFTSPGLRALGLKIAIVFLHPSCTFEVWLAANNRKLQKQYWDFFEASNWERYHLLADIQGLDAILDHVIEKAPDFSDQPELMRRIEAAALQFGNEIQGYLADNPLP